jgi:hypothetical protein
MMEIESKKTRRLMTVLTVPTHFAANEAFHREGTPAPSTFRMDPALDFTGNSGTITEINVEIPKKIPSREPLPFQA